MGCLDLATAGQDSWRMKKLLHVNILNQTFCMSACPFGRILLNSVGQFHMAVQVSDPDVCRMQQTVLHLQLYDQAALLQNAVQLGRIESVCAQNTCMRPAISCSFFICHVVVARCAQRQRDMLGKLSPIVLGDAECCSVFFSACELRQSLFELQQLLVAGPPSDSRRNASQDSRHAGARDALTDADKDEDSASSLTMSSSRSPSSGRSDKRGLRDATTSMDLQTAMQIVTSHYKTK